MTFTRKQRSTFVSALKESFGSDYARSPEIMYKEFKTKDGKAINLDVIIDEALVEFPDTKSYSVTFDEIWEWIYDVAEMEIDHFGILTDEKTIKMIDARKEIFHIMRENRRLIGEGLEERGFTCESINCNGGIYTVVCKPTKTY